MADVGLCAGKISLINDTSVHEPSTVGFLNQCKFELSAEVIRWKEENHKLRREKEASEQEIHELRSVLDRLIRRNEELEASLLSTNQQYEKLKMHSIAINEENKFLHRKLSKTRSKYYSYPCYESGISPVLPLLNENIHQLSKRDVDVPKSWEEVSEKLIEQMKLEIKELQMLGQKLAINDLPSSESIQAGRTSVNEQYIPSNRMADGSDVEGSIISLACDLELQKQHLKDQQQKLSVLLNRMSDREDLAVATDGVHLTQNVSGVKRVDSVSGLMNWEPLDVSERKFERPSDDKFRAYFTQQLSNSKSTEELKCMLNFYVDSSKGFFHQNDVQNIPEHVKGPTVCVKTQPKCSRSVDMQTVHTDDSCVCLDETIIKPMINNSPSSSKNCSPEDERVCPICEAAFPRVFSQKEFESHVVAHLEAGSASLLDQYEIF